MTTEAQTASVGTHDLLMATKYTDSVGNTKIRASEISITLTISCDGECEISNSTSNSTTNTTSNSTDTSTSNSSSTDTSTSTTTSTVTETTIFEDAKALFD